MSHPHRSLFEAIAMPTLTVQTLTKVDYITTYFSDGAGPQEAAAAGRDAGHRAEPLCRPPSHRNEVKQDFMYEF